MNPGRGGWAMGPKPKSTSELVIEAAKARRLAELTLGVGGELMQRVKEVSHRIEDRVRQVTTSVTVASSSNQERAQLARRGSSVPVKEAVVPNPQIIDFLR